MFWGNGRSENENRNGIDFEGKTSACVRVRKNKQANKQTNHGVLWTECVLQEACCASSFLSLLSSCVWSLPNLTAYHWEVRCALSFVFQACRLNACVQQESSFTCMT